MVKNLHEMQETWVYPWGRKIHWKRKWQLNLVFLPGESHRQRSLMGYSSQGHKELDTIEQLTPKQEKTLHMDISRWSTLKSDWLYSLQPKGENSIQSAKTRPGADCGSDHKLLIAKCRLKSKKVGKTTRPFRYDLNHIPYSYTVEVRNRFKGLDLIECLKTMDRGLWHCIGGRDQGHPQEKEMRKGKMVVWGGLTNNCENKRSERQRRKGKICLFECRVPKNSKES